MFMPTKRTMVPTMELTDKEFSGIFDELEACARMRAEAVRRLTVLFGSAEAAEQHLADPEVILEHMAEIAFFLDVRRSGRDPAKVPPPRRRCEHCGDYHLPTPSGMDAESYARLAESFRKLDKAEQAESWLVELRGGNACPLQVAKVLRETSCWLVSEAAAIDAAEAEERADGAEVR
jgi:hypothetical protein